MTALSLNSNESQRFYFGLTIFIIGFLILLQASDMNPFLSINSYCVWLNQNFPLGTKFLFLWLLPCLSVGGVAVMFGFKLMGSRKH